jgi:hypothetical protein
VGFDTHSSTLTGQEGEGAAERDRAGVRGRTALAERERGRVSGERRVKLTEGLCRRSPPFFSRRGNRAARARALCASQSDPAWWLLGCGVGLREDRGKKERDVPGGRRVTGGCEIDQDSYGGPVQGVWPLRRGCCEGKARQGKARRPDERGLRLLSVLTAAAARAHLRSTKFVPSAGGQPLSRVSEGPDQSCQSCPRPLTHLLEGAISPQALLGRRTCAHE